MNYLEKLLLGIDDDPDRFDLVHERWVTMKQIKRDSYTKIAMVLNEHLAEFIKYGRLLPGTVGPVLTTTGLKSRVTLWRYMWRCVKFQANPKYRDWPREYALVNRAGPPRFRLLAREEQIFVIGARLWTDWEVLIPEGTPHIKRKRLEADQIYSGLIKIFPSTKASATYVADFLKAMEAEDPALFAISWMDTKKFWMEFVPKMPSTFSEPDECWSGDGRIAPIWFRYQGQVTTGTFYTLLDMFSEFVPAWSIVPRRVLDSEGNQKKTDFLRDDVCIVIANAMRKTKRRSSIIYLDNASQHKWLRFLLPTLTTIDEEPIDLIFGWPGHPWTRSKMETIQKFYDECLSNLPGFVHDEDNPTAWEAAKGEDLLDLDDLIKVMAKYWNAWNTRKRGEVPSRFHIWRDTPKTHRPAPPLARLAMFACVQEFRNQKVHDYGVSVYDTAYKPAIRTQEDINRWEDLIGKWVAIQEISLDGEICVLVCTDSSKVTWEQWFPSDQELPGPKRRKRLQRGVVASVQARLDHARAHFLDLLKKLGVIIPQIDPVDGLVFPSANKANSTVPPDNQTAPAKDSATEVAPITSAPDGANTGSTAEQINATTPKDDSTPLEQKASNGRSRRQTRSQQPAVQTADMPTDEAERGQGEEEGDFFDLARQLRAGRKQSG